MKTRGRISDPARSRRRALGAVLKAQVVDEPSGAMPVQIPPLPGQSRVDLEKRRKSIINLLDCLRAFADARFHMLEQGASEGGAYALAESEAWPFSYVYDALSNQVAYDMDVAFRALAQRSPDASDAAMRDTLVRADLLAGAALKHASNASLIEPAAAITYYQKSPLVRVIPYAPVALIGIPYSAIGNARDLLAIPHEVGHHVYHHSRFGKQHVPARVRQMMSDTPLWLQRWQEEIFADVFGCTVAGPVLALSFQELANAKSRATFSTDDGEHPIPALRPWIYLDALEQMEIFPNATSQLTRRWSDILDDRGKPDAFTPHGTSERVDYEAAREALREIVARIGREFIGLEPGYEDQQTTGTEQDDRGTYVQSSPWSTEILQANTPDGTEAELLSSFEEFAATIRSVDFLELAIQDGADRERVVCVVSQRDSKAACKQNSHRVGETGRWFDRLLADQGQEEAVGLPADVWIRLLDMDGWTTEGPDVNPHG